MQVQQKIDELTDLDRRLYDSGKRAFEEVRIILDASEMGTSRHGRIQNIGAERLNVDGPGVLR